TPRRTERGRADLKVCCYGRDPSCSRGPSGPRLEGCLHFLRAANLEEITDGQVREESAEQSEARDARTEARHASQRALRQESDEPQAGDCDWIVRGAPRRRKNSAQAEEQWEEGPCV